MVCVGVDLRRKRAMLRRSTKGRVRQADAIPQRHPDRQLAATSSLLTSSTGSPVGLRLTF